MAITQPSLWKKLLGSAFLVGVVAIVVPLYLQRIEHYVATAVLQEPELDEFAKSLRAIGELSERAASTM